MDTDTMPIPELERLVSKRKDELKKIYDFVNEATIELGRMVSRTTGAYGCYKSEWELPELNGFCFNVKDNVLSNQIQITYFGRDVFEMKYKGGFDIPEILFEQAGSWQDELYRMMNIPDYIQDNKRRIEQESAKNRKAKAEKLTESKIRKQLQKQAEQMKLVLK